MLLKGPLKKGDVRVAIDKRIEASRSRRRKLVVEAQQEDRVAVAKEAATESVLQSLRKELLGERLPKRTKASL